MAGHDITAAVVYESFFGNTQSIARAVVTSGLVEVLGPEDAAD